jgi:hypothetical protein
MDWTIPVRLWIVEQPKVDFNTPGTKSHRLRTTFAEHGYFPTEWDLSAFCVQGYDCTGNVAYVPKGAEKKMQVPAEASENYEKVIYRGFDKNK